MEGALLKYSTTQLLAKVEEKNADTLLLFAPKDYVQNIVLTNQR